MRLFYDCEFLEYGRGIPMKIVSVGMVREDGTELYRINPECLSDVARHPWLSVNVAPYLPIKATPGILAWDEDHEEYPFVSMSLDGLIDDVLKFIQGTPAVQLWSDYSAHDYVVLTQLFGSMNELPAGVPMRTNDLQQLVDMRPGVILPPAPWRIHHAMEDARWCREAFDQVWNFDPASVSQIWDMSLGPFIEGVVEDRPGG